MVRVRKRVLAIGDVNLDLLFLGLERLPSAEQESLAQDLQVLVGGQTGTVARALSRLGWAVSFVGRVGDDEYGRTASRALAAAGVDTSGLVIDPASRTGVTAVLSAGTQRAYVTFAGSAAQARRADVNASLPLAPALARMLIGRIERVDSIEQGDAGKRETP